MEIPKILIDDIRAGNVVLFLGAGASYGALHPKNEQIPLGKTLANKMAEKFLGDSYLDSDLTTVSEVAISQKSLYDVQDFVKEVFADFSPSPFHQIIPTFQWKAIFTVNYDWIIEKAYKEGKTNKTALQLLNPIWKDGREQDVFKQDHVTYFKLHGSLDCIDDETVPLILTQDQYISHKNKRENLFNTLKEYAKSYTFLYVGFSFADWDIRKILNQIGSHETKPRSYMVGPYIKPEEASLWEGKKITSFVIPFSKFLTEIDGKIEKPFRKIGASLPKYDHPIYGSFSISIKEKSPSETLTNFLENEIDFIHRAMPTPHTDPKDFYKGYFENWDPILRSFDVARSLKDGIISEVFLDEENLLSTSPQLFVLKGHAGSGKSVMLKRLAFDAGTSFDCFCIFLKSNSNLTYEALYELYGFVKSRIFVFVDHISSHAPAVARVVTRSQRDRIPITIFGAERTNVWNVDCGSLEELVENDFQLKFLNEKEIRELITLLTRYDSLGYLKNKSFDEQVEIFKDKSEKELLVALHEATQGKQFHEIIQDEFNSIADSSARSLYLTVCILHRLGAYARAGLISRVHGINFNEFKERLFAPLDHIVFTNYNSKIDDYVYTSRHPQIADMVFETILKEKQDKYSEYVRILTNLNINYDSDRIAFIAMTNATDLLSLFDDPLKIRNLYEIASEKSVDNPKLYQQQAIFEMKRPNGNFNTAEEFLFKAFKQDPNDPQIAHSFAEFALKKAENSKYKVEVFKNLDQCKEICIKLIKKGNKDRDRLLHPYHTILKAELYLLHYTLQNEKGPTIERQVKEIEKLLGEAKQLFPDEAFILELESRYNTVLNETDKAYQALQQAYEVNKSNPFICLRLASFLEQEGKIDEAIAICKGNLRINPSERELNFKVGMLLWKKDNPDLQEVKLYLRKSFLDGDTRYVAKFWYGRLCFLMKEYTLAKEVFDALAKANIAPDIKYAPKGIVKSNGNDVYFTGQILRKEVSFGIVRRADFGDTILFTIRTEEAIWDQLFSMQKISFKLAFNYKGPVAVAITPME